MNYVLFPQRIWENNLFGAIARCLFGKEKWGNQRSIFIVLVLIFNYEQDEQSGVKPIAANSVRIAYSGASLTPGFIYDWEFVTTGKTYRSTFVIMTEEERQAIIYLVKPTVNLLKPTVYLFLKSA